MNSFYAVVMAGGSGTRFWPLSRRHRPKQLLPLLGGASLIRRTVERLSPLFEPERIFVVTARPHGEAVGRESGLPPDQVIEEPAGRDTAAAVGLAATFLRWRDPEATFAVLPADHDIDDAARLQGDLRLAFEASRAGALVTLGIPPRRASTEYGYLHRGDRVSDRLYRVRRFCEKPPAATARAFVEGGEHYWNSGMFVWTASSILSAIGRHLPDLVPPLEAIGEALGTRRLPSVLAEQYGKVPRVSIDYGVMEKAEEVLMVEAGFGWDDVGSWAAAAERRPRDEAGNALEGKAVPVETKDSLLLSADPEHLVATLGLEGVVVVHTPDATLVCPKERAGELRKVVEEIRRRGHEKHL